VPSPPPTTGGTTHADRRRPARARPTIVELDLWTFAAVVLALLAMLGFIGLVRGAADTLTKLAVGALIALALDPVVRAVQSRFQLARSTAVVMVAGALLVVFTTVALVLGPAAVREAGKVATDLPETVKSFYSWPIVGERLERADAAGTVSQWIDELPQQFDQQGVERLAETILGGVQTLFIVLVAAIAVMIDGEALVARARRLVPPARRERADEAGRIVHTSIGRYFAGSLLVAGLNGLVVLGVGLLLGIPLAPVAGIWSTLTNLIPQIGGFLGGGFFVLLALSKSPLTAVIALAFFLVYQQIENHVIAPAIVGRAVNLSPPTTMLAALIGGAAAGVPGALAATPLVGAGKALYFALRQRRGRAPADDGPGSSGVPDRR